MAGNGFAVAPRTPEAGQFGAFAEGDDTAGGVVGFGKKVPKKLLSPKRSHDVCKVSGGEVENRHCPGPDDQVGQDMQRRPGVSNLIDSHKYP